MLRTFPAADSPTFDHDTFYQVDPTNESLSKRKEKILTFLRSENRAFGKYEIANHLGEGYTDSHITYALDLLKKDGKIENVSHGAWRAVQRRRNAAPIPQVNNHVPQRGQAITPEYVAKVRALLRVGVTAEEIPVFLALQNVG